MKASEICIGDWFKAIDYNSPFRITAIYDDVVQTQADYQSEIDGNWYSEAEIKDLVPIELTEDILEKNGFRHSISHNDWTNADCNFFLYEGGNGFRVQNTDIRLEYVHQLQHLLRLCGVEKELAI